MPYAIIRGRNGRRHEVVEPQQLDIRTKTGTILANAGVVRSLTAAPFKVMSTKKTPATCESLMDTDAMRMAIWLPMQ
jgi:hypothetical protein